MQTPSPFRLPRRPPSARRSGSQFANSPRFLLSQSTPQKAKGADIVEDDDFPPTAPVAYTPLRSVGASRRRRDVIEDSDDGEFPLNPDSGRKGTSDREDVLIDKTPPSDSNALGPLDADFDVLFTPVQNTSNKRRRVAAEAPHYEKSRSTEALPTSSPPEAGDQGWHIFEPSAPCQRPTTTYEGSDIQETPSCLSARPLAQESTTPGNMKTPFRSKPKFVISSKKPPSSQPSHKLTTPAATQDVSPPERRKPNFVLPKSPSPKKPTDDIPAPFSPSSRTLRRRGRPRSGVPAYAPGGMAAEVRSWILETGSKRVHAPPQSISTTIIDGFITSTSQYLVVARVVKARHGGFSSSGPLTFIEAHKLIDSPGRVDPDGVQFILMGLPRSSISQSTRQSLARVQAGDLIGIRRGLAWDVDLCASLSMEKELIDDPKRKNKDPPEGRWLVAMEWDLICEATS